MSEDGAELEYYRAVEDLFAGLRGVPHTLSSKDFQLLRSWWRDGVPLAAITTGVTEVFARRRQAGEDDPVVSLTYCRHAVRRAARRLAERRAGTTEEGASSTPEDGVAALGHHLERAAASQEEGRPEVARCIRSIRAKLLELPGSGDAISVEEGLYALETALLESCWNALDRDERAEIEDRARHAAGDATDAVRERAIRAHRDRELRLLLGLPRLELP